MEQEDAIQLTEGEEVTLMNWGNVVITQIKKNEEGHVIEIHARLHLQGDFRLTKFKLTWLPSTDLVPLELVEYDTILTKDIGKDENFQDFVNENSKAITKAIGESALRGLPVGTKLQFERVGYFILDKISENGTHVFILIPDGHPTNVFLSSKIAVKTLENKPKKGKSEAPETTEG